MVHRALAGLVTSLILGCATVAPVPPGAAPPSHWSRGAADRIARDLGLTPLRLARPDVEREIRIWTLGGGYMIPDPMVRLREQRGRVSG